MSRRRPLLRSDELWVGRREPGGALTYWDTDGDRLASVLPHESAWEALTENLHRDIAPTWTVTDDAGVVFTLVRYDAAEDLSFDVRAPDGACLATFYVDAGLIHDEVIVRDAAAAPVGEIETDDGIHELRELNGAPLASAQRVLERGGGDGLEQVWHVRIDDPEQRLFDRRVLVATPLVCLLTGRPKREWDPDSTVAVTLLVAFPPAGLVLLAVERAIDGLYWLRRKLN